ncbi:MAG: hypothetical protein HIU92_09045 [Proteobacteria bacterium]|nr:hypothetical protein [Pseudomonadota bacterium]
MKTVVTHRRRRARRTAALGDAATPRSPEALLLDFRTVVSTKQRDEGRDPAKRSARHIVALPVTVNT